MNERSVERSGSQGVNHKVNSVYAISFFLVEFQRAGWSIALGKTFGLSGESLIGRLSVEVTFNSD